VQPFLKLFEGTAYQFIEASLVTIEFESRLLIKDKAFGSGGAPLYHLSVSSKLVAKTGLLLI
jgi:hypothetical protein